MHALIVEDEPLIALAIEDVLRDNGFHSFAFAVSVQEAIDAVAARCPDLITSDVELNPGNGMDAVEEICGRAAVPTIFITSNAAAVHERLPQYLVLRKPFRVADFEAALEHVTAG